ncbi:uncharacterized protein LOC123905098 [Trifolium pratense]|uniref:Uncharacterized protein n=1 Tax=Trifolium pratense TaxID=57577 RepID=A0ACB0LF85_TRIPR|nr:uncharacterized protein LOC123905003 [Trifolium pratense]XP_045810695.1 uncharacterized protein LOC123905098 [Trifolium pratense]CAJ2667051.1 unnamed protein product [Trifolium pratense]
MNENRTDIDEPMITIRDRARNLDEIFLTIGVVFPITRSAITIDLEEAGHDITEGEACFIGQGTGVLRDPSPSILERDRFQPWKGGGKLPVAGDVGRRKGRTVEEEKNSLKKQEYGRNHFGQGTVKGNNGGASAELNYVNGDVERSHNKIGDGGASGCALKRYKSKPNDTEWAYKGVVATVFNGESLSVVHNRIMDAGFSDLILIPMGADKVFVHSTENGDAMSVINNAKEFFQLVFWNWMRWDKETSPYRRGAWVRLYGVPLHAWNEQFFQLCVFESGRFLRTDSSSVEKTILDFARVLIATPELDIIKKSVSVLVDEIIVEIKIVEEWGYAMGEDSCLFDEGSEFEESQADYSEGQVDPEVNRSVDMLIDKFKEGLDEEDLVEGQGMRDDELLDKSEAKPGPERVGISYVLGKGSKCWCKP